MTTEFSTKAADAAVLQLAEEPSIAVHPAKALFDRTVEAILPAVRTFALAKNVPIDEHDVMPVAEHAVRNISRRAMRAIRRLDPDAIQCVQNSVNHSLDILWLAKYIVAVFEASGREADMESAIILAAHLCTKDHANDRTQPRQR